MTDNLRDFLNSSTDEASDVASWQIEPSDKFAKQFRNKRVHICPYEQMDPTDQAFNKLQNTLSYQRWQMQQDRIANQEKVANWSTNSIEYMDQQSKKAQDYDDMRDHFESITKKPNI